MDVPLLNEDALAELSDPELAEYVAMLEDAAREKVKRDARLFARQIPLPGAPDKANIMATDWERKLAIEKGRELPPNKPDGEVEFYPERLDPQPHHDIILEKMQALVEGELINDEGEAADGVMFFMPPGSAKPICADALVHMGDGSRRPLRNVRVGDFVICESGEARRVDAVHDQGKLECVEITLASGRSLVCAPDHPILCHAGYVDAGRLRPGDYVALMANAKHIGVIPDKQEVARASLAGYLIGDGSVVISGKNQWGSNNIAANVTCGDPVVADHVAKMAELSGFTATKKNYADRPDVTVVRLAGGVREWLRDEHMVGQTSRTKRVPEFVWKGGVFSWQAFLGAYMACDGSVYNKRGRNKPVAAVDAVTVSPELARDIQSLFMRLGVMTHIQCRDTGYVRKDGTRTISYRNTLATQHDVWLAKRELGKFWKGEKFDRFKVIPTKPGRIDQALLGDKVVSIESVGLRDCMCLTVKTKSNEEPSFVADDVVVHNSSYATMLAPAYFMGRFPGFQTIIASYAQSLTNGFSRRVQAICKLPEYQEIYGVAPRQGNTGIEEWALDNESRLRAAGMLGGITGFRCDLCLAGHTLVETPSGYRRIDSIKAGDYVRSYDFISKRPTFNRVVAVARRDTDEIWRITTREGSVVDASDNHPFFNGDGWKEAASLTVGDVLMRAVRKTQQGRKLRSDQKGYNIRILQQLLFHAIEQRSAWHVWQDLQQLWASIWIKPDLLGCVPHRDCETLRPESANGAGQDVRSLWPHVSSKNESGGGAVLLNGMQEQGPLGSDVQRPQSELEGWEGPKPIPGGEWSEVSSSKARGTQAGSMLHNVWRFIASAGASHRWKQHQQRDKQHRYLVRDVSPQAARCGEAETADDYVAVVERLREKSVVYDIQVEETHCFFANDILVHNCIIDDPVKNAEDADSDIIRQKIWEEWETSLTTRFKGVERIAMIMTRWHIDDLAGRILSNEDSAKKWNGESGFWRGTDKRLWYVVRIPMIADRKDDPLGRGVGEQLWPEKFRPRNVQLRKETSDERGGTRDWNSLYQQLPTISGGNIIRRDWWQRWTEKDERGHIQPPLCETVLLMYDTAFEKGEENDYNAMTAWGCFPRTVQVGARTHNQYHMIMLGAWRGKVDAADMPDIIKKHIKFFGADTAFIEKRASGAQILQELKRARAPVRSWLPGGAKGTKGKESRMYASQFIFANSAVWYVPGKETNLVVDEVCNFPNGTHDDYADTVTMAMDVFRRRYLMQIPTDEWDDDEYEVHQKAEFEKRRQPTRRLYG